MEAVLWRRMDSGVGANTSMNVESDGDEPLVAANLRIKLQTKNTKLLLCHRVST
jgi:hypothetical protein